MNPNILGAITPCITAFRRPERLKRAVDSCVAVGFPRIAISSMGTTAEVRDAIDECVKKYPKTSFICEIVEYDKGCNESWLRAAYLSPTEYLIILHDDDYFKPELAKHVPKILHHLDRGAAVASWRGDAVKDDGSVREFRYVDIDTSFCGSSSLSKVIMAWGHASLSPVISVMRRSVLISALKEADAFFDSSPLCWHNPGMPYGTEIIAYMRHAERFPSWYYIDEALSCFGDWEGSGTIDAETRGGWEGLLTGYDLARRHCAHNPGPGVPDSPRLIYVWEPYTPKGEVEKVRYEHASLSRELLFNQGRVIPAPFHPNPQRTGKVVGDTAPVPFIRDMLDMAAVKGADDDLLVITNTDVGPVVDFEPRIQALFEKKKHDRNAIALLRASYTPGYTPLPPYSDLRNGKIDNGVDGIVVRKTWWKKYRDYFPDMLLGREAWDSVFRTLIKESHPSLEQDEYEIPYLICHEHHASHWQDGWNRRQNFGQKHNLVKAENFFTSRGRLYGWVDGSSESPGLSPIRKLEL